MKFTMPKKIVIETDDEMALAASKHFVDLQDEAFSILLGAMANAEKSRAHRQRIELALRLIKTVQRQIIEFNEKCEALQSLRQQRSEKKWRQIYLAEFLNGQISWSDFKREMYFSLHQYWSRYENATNIWPGEFYF